MGLLVTTAASALLSVAFASSQAIAAHTNKVIGEVCVSSFRLTAVPAVTIFSIHIVADYTQQRFKTQMTQSDGSA